MRGLVQRVTTAQVRVDSEVVGRIGAGLCVLVGVGRNDQPSDAVALARKLIGLRLFSDADGKMNEAVLAHGGEILAVSQFTLFGDVKKGNRPSFGGAMEPGRAEELFELFCAECRERGARVETGRFRTHMQVELTNDGPVTLWIDTERTF